MSNLLCFLCDNYFQTSKKLIDHLKLEHGVPAIYKFKCKQYQCKQIFHNVHAFKKHMLRHENQNSYLNLSTNSNISNNSNPTNTNNTHVASNYNCESSKVNVSLENLCSEFQKLQM